MATRKQLEQEATALRELLGEAFGRAELGRLPDGRRVLKTVHTQQWRALPARTVKFATYREIPSE